MKKNLRQFLINILDDENGISQAAYDGFAEHIPDDIKAAAKGVEGRVFLGEDDAIELRAVI
jgi:hypothetical protein